MKSLFLILSILSLVMMTGCSGGGGAAEAIADSINQGENDGDIDQNDPQTPDDSGNGSQPTDPNNGGNTSNPTNPTGPQPGDKVENTEGSQFASYPNVGTPVSYERNIQAEPNSDTMIPIVSIVNQPAPYIPQTQTRVDIWAADNVNGTGLREIQCSVDSASYSVCGEQLDLSNLNDGLHSVSVRAQDYDDNYSEEAQYYFYVDTTPPVVSIVNSPGAVTSPQENNFQFSSNEEGSGLAKYECQVNGGQYQDCNENLALQNLESGNQQINVRAVDNVGNTSGETQYSWVVDGDAPIITINSQPNDVVYIEFDTPAVNFSVVDTLSPQGVTIICTVNGQAQACASGQDVLIPTNAPTNYVFSVTATDSVGNSATQTVQWQSLFAAEDRSTVTSVSDDRPVDILFVIDNSGSMNFERSSLAQRIDGMISKINGLDWQIAVISTDATNNDAKSMGRLIELIGMPGEYILDSTMDEAMAQSVFGNTVQNFGAGSGREEGIYSSKLAIDRFLAGEQPHQSFFRDGADLSIVVLSDEDEDSQGNNIRITPQGFVNHIDQSFNGQKNMVFHSIIARPNDQNCLSDPEHYAGDVYDELSRLTGFGEVGGAIIGSVCESDYTSQLEDIGQSVKDNRNSIRLECQPFDSNGDGQPDLVISYRADSGSNYSVYTAPRQVSGGTVTFTGLLPPGDYKVDYQCRIN